MAPATIRRILVAVKEPAASASVAVTKSAALARALNAELLLFHDIDLPVYSGVYVSRERQLGDDEESIRAHYLHALEDQAAPLRASGLTVSVAAEWDFPAYEAILRATRDAGADLVVTEHHRSSESRLWALHPNDWELMRLSPMPVLLIKDPRPYRGPVMLAALDPLHTHSKPADLDARIVRLTQILSTALSGTWHVVHATGAPPRGTQPADPSCAITSASLRENTRSQVGTTVADLLERLSAAPVSLRLVDRPPSQAIVQTAHDLNASIVVMGAVSRSGLKRVLIGNTAEHVFDALSCDLLVVKPRSFEIRFPTRRRGVNLRPAALPLPL